MNGIPPLPLCLVLPSSSSCSLHHTFHCSGCSPPLPPFTYPLVFAGLCYDWNQCVLHTSLLAPILRRDAHIKECHFQRSRVSHAHKCCPDTWSGKIKTACLPVRVLCGGCDCRGRCLRCPFQFLLPSCFFFSLLPGSPDTHGFCKNLCGCGGWVASRFRLRI